MRKAQAIILVSVLAIQPVFADNAIKVDEVKPCDMIAKACLKAGFTDGKVGNKQFWDNCMKPILLNEKIKEITLDDATVTSCRNDRIKEIKQELSELEKVK